MGRVKLAELEERRLRIARLNGQMKRTEDIAFRELKAGQGKRYVPGKGSMAPKAVFVAEAPGRNENLIGEPLLGEGGRIFDILLGSVGLTREDIYVTYAVKWWPTTSEGKMRTPTALERSASRYGLIQELSVLQVWQIVALGQNVARMFLPTIRERARWHQASELPFKVLPLMHPVVAVYQRALQPLMAYEFRAVMEKPNATE